MRRGRQIVQVRDSKCEKGALGDNSKRKKCECVICWVKGCIGAVLLCLEDTKGGKKSLGGYCSVYVCFCCSCGIVSENNGTKLSYLCNLSSNSSIYLVVFSFSRLSVWRTRSTKTAACYFLCYFHQPWCGILATKYSSYPIKADLLLAILYMGSIIGSHHSWISTVLRNRATQYRSLTGSLLRQTHY